MYSHLIISGGGIKGIAIIGVLKVLFKNNLINNLEGYIGSSVGGLICFLLNIGYTYVELKHIIFNINFSEYRNINISNIFNNWGLDNCDNLMKLIMAIIKQKNISYDITFKQLYEKTNKELVLTGSELIKNEIKYYSYKETPDMKILEAIRITISYPIIFNPIKKNITPKNINIDNINNNDINNDDINNINNKNNNITADNIDINKEILVDGGLFAPYPMEYFKDIKNKIGIIIHSNNINNIIDSEDYLINIIKCLTIRYEKIFLKDYVDDTIIIDLKNIYSMNFELSDNDKNEIYKIGINTAEKYINDNKNDNKSDLKKE